MVNIFLDGADAIFQNKNNPYVSGFTTNPSLMKKAGVKNYMSFAREVLSEIKDKPVALEVLSDNLLDMYTQGLKLQELGDNVNVKIPVVNSHGVSTISTVSALVKDGVTVNVTAITEISSVVKLLPVLYGFKGYLSVFAGRIADTGRDPVPILSKIKYLTNSMDGVKIIWASTREVYNIYEAEYCSDVITVSDDILKRYLTFFDLELKEVCHRTVKQFAEDGAGFIIE